jgi:signal transduction histidine kinase
MSSTDTFWRQALPCSRSGSGNVAKRGRSLAAFTVDTKLFRELGDLLVSKESTALVELIKNAYDADATVVTVRGTNLRHADEGQIVVRDDGVGMTAEEFQNGFLRIAGRTKITADRRSPVFGRRYTGEKGIGRLAAHKLARKVVIDSRRAGRASRGAAELPAATQIIQASIDWDTIEEFETFDEVASSEAVVLRRMQPSGQRVLASGTTLTMSPLRRSWSNRRIDEFLKEAVTLAPAPVLWDRLPDGVVAESLLFDVLPVRDQSQSDPGFRIDLSGDLAVPDIITPNVAETASWIAEAEYDRDTGLLRVAIAPTKSAIRRFPLSEGFRFDKRLGPKVGPSFRARILQRSESAWAPPVQGIRIFLEGFRVPPYGDTTDDWIGIDRTYRSRGHRQLTSLSNLDIAGLPEGLENEELAVQGHQAYMGAILLHRASTPELSMLANREGFLPGAGLDFIADWMRVVTDLIVRLGFSSRRETKRVRQKDRVRQRHAAQKADVNETPTALLVRESAQAAERQLDIVRSAIHAGDYNRAAQAAGAAQPHLGDVLARSEEFGGEAVLWRVLASLGTELAAFVHEINALALEAGAIVAELDVVLPDLRAGPAKSKVQRARGSVFALADRIRRNATYLVDATSFKGRRRRSRLPLRERFDGVLPLFETRLAARRIQISNEIPADLRMPPMFPAELAGIFTNLVSNAVKFAGDGGRIRVSTDTTDNMIRVTVENTGTRVDLATARKFFEAFQSTTERPDAVLGQGMGMGLTITRAFVQEYGGTIEFVRPTAGYSTAIRFAIPAR